MIDFTCFLIKINEFEELWGANLDGISCYAWIEKKYYEKKIKIFGIIKKNLIKNNQIDDMVSNISLAYKNLIFYL